MYIFIKNFYQIELVDQTISVTIYSTWVEEKKGIFDKSTPQYFWGQKPTFKEEIDYFALIYKARINYWIFS